MKHQRVRAAVIAASTLGLATGATLAAADGAQAAVRPAVSSNWECNTLSTPVGGVVYGDTCLGYGTGVGWLQVSVGGGAYKTEYRCTSFTSAPETPVYYTVIGSGCTPYA
jgi:hypothetical protein